MRLSEAGELGLLRELERRGLATGQDAEGAILGGGRVATLDVLAEGIHFRLDWTSFRDLGYKAAAVNLSDLAALGADAEGLLVGLGAPANAEVEQVVELYEGLNEAGVPVIGGDTTRAGHYVALGGRRLLPALPARQLRLFRHEDWFHDAPWKTAVPPCAFR